MKTKLMTELFKWGVMTAIVAVAMPELAAAETVKDVVTGVVQNELPVLPYALGAACYVGGSFMMVSGALSLKKHAEAPTSEPMGKGIARLLTGGTITALPALTGVIKDTANITGGQADPTKFTVTF